MRREVCQAALAAVAVMVSAWVAPARAQSLTAVQTGTLNSTIRLSPLVNLTYNNGTTNVAATPIDMATIPGDKKLYIGTYSGTNPLVLIVDPYAKTQSATPFLSFSDFGTQTLVAGQGMQGMTFSPNFNDPTKPGYRKFYTYTAEKSATATGSNSVMFLHPEIPNPSTTAASTAVLREWTANSAGTAIDTAVAPRVVLNFGTPAGHMGGGLKFGPDGYLYLSTGDGGGNGDGGSQTSTTDGFTGRDATGTATDVPGISNGQDFTNALGKVLRIDPYVTNGDGTPRATPAGSIAKTFSSQTKYFVPGNNPFVGNTQNVYFTPIGPVASQTPVAPMEEIFAIGFRNPWKLSFDKNAAAGAMPYVADVGSRTREEVDLVQAGKNYGWPYREGDVISATAAGTRPTPIPYVKQVSPGVYAAYDLDPTFNDPAQMAGPIARLGTRSGSANPLVFADRPGSDIFGDGAYGWQYGDGNSVTGGFVYRGTAMPELYGKYVFGAYEFLVEDTTRTNGAKSAGGRLFYFDPNEVATTKTVKEFNYDLSGSTIPANGGGALMGVVQADNGDLFAMLAGGSVFKLNPNPGWNTDGDGAWSGATNWSGAVPNAINAATYFGPNITAPRAVTVDGAKTVGAINFDSPVSYTLGGSTLTLDVAGDVGIQAAINVVDGSHVISAPIVLNKNLVVSVDQPASLLSLTGTLSAAGKAITKDGHGTAQFENIRTGTLTVNQGVARIRPRWTPNDPNPTSRVNHLSIAASGQLDLADNALVIDYVSVGTLVTEVRQHLLNSRLVSSSADAQHRLGYADNAVLHLNSFAGESVTDDAILIRFTYSGDSDLDGDVDSTDLAHLASHWQQPGAWTGGDFTYDGVVDIRDLYQLAITWQLGVPNPLPASSLTSMLGGLGLPVVAPEPGILSVLGIAAAGAMARRRRRD